MAKTQRVSRRPDGRWQHKADGNQRATRVADTRKGALDSAKGVAQRQGGEVIVHGADGRIVGKDSYGYDPKPRSHDEHEETNVGTFARLKRGLTIPMPTDDEGLAGRECPNPECLGYFKVKFGTGLQASGLPCHCPYCGHTSSSDDFWTPDQLEYARSMVISSFEKALKQHVLEWDRDLKRSSNRFLKLSVSFSGSRHPIHYYREKELETKITCDVCSLEYSVYGVFAFCPDCGTHNSLQMLGSNLSFARKELQLASSSEDKEFARFLLADALENAVSAFDGFGRHILSMHCEGTSLSEQARGISFQNITKARERVQALAGFDFADGISAVAWGSVVRAFQKRHVFAHSMGVVDQPYIEATEDMSVTVGRKMPIEAGEIEELMVCLQTMGARLRTGLSVH